MPQLYMFSAICCGCAAASVPFIFGLYRLDINARNDGLTQQLVRLLERRFNHRRVAALTAQVDAEVEEARSKRPALFRFEVPLDPELVNDTNRQQWDDKNAATWGIDPRVNIEYYSKSLADPESKSASIDKVLYNVAATRTYLQAVLEGKI